MRVCCLCKSESESHDHLFFKCQFSNDIWKSLLPMMNCIVQNEEWNSIITYIAAMGCTNNIWSVIRRLCLGAMVYFIWQERNFRTFRDETRDSKTVCRIICESVRMKIMSLKVKKSNEVMSAASIWNVKLDD